MVQEASSPKKEQLAGPQSFVKLQEEDFTSNGGGLKNVYIHTGVYPSYLIDKRWLFKNRHICTVYVQYMVCVQKPPSRGCHLHLAFCFDYESPTIYMASIRTRAVKSGF